MTKLKNRYIQVATLGGSSYENTFKLSKNPILKKIWDVKMVNDKKSLFKKKQDGVNLIMADSRYVQFDNYFAIKTFPEYIRCDIKDIQQAITYDRSNIRQSLKQNSTTLLGLPFLSLRMDSLEKFSTMPSRRLWKVGRCIESEQNGHYQVTAGRRF